MLNLTRDEWMVVNRALQDRIAALEGRGNVLVGAEIDECRRLEKLTREYVDQTWIAPAA